MICTMLRSTVSTGAGPVRGGSTAGMPNGGARAESETVAGTIPPATRSVFGAIMSGRPIDDSSSIAEWAMTSRALESFSPGTDVGIDAGSNSLGRMATFFVVGPDSAAGSGLRTAGAVASSSATSRRVWSWPRCSGFTCRAPGRRSWSDERISTRLIESMPRSVSRPMSRFSMSVG